MLKFEKQGSDGNKKVIGFCKIQYQSHIEASEVRTEKRPYLLIGKIFITHAEMEIVSRCISDFIISVAKQFVVGQSFFLDELIDINLSWYLVAELFNMGNNHSVVNHESYIWYLISE